MIKDIIERSSLLLALNRQYPRGIETKRLDSLLPNWKQHVSFLRKRGIDIEVKEYVRLGVPVYYDLYQSVPPEIRTDVEEILWKLVNKEPIVNETMINQKVIRPIDKAIEKFSSIPQPSTLRIDPSGVKWILKGGEEFPVACIHCAEPLCVTYRIEAFAPTDAFSSRVCPADVIKQSSDGIVTIDQSGCSGCMLCIVRCPIDAIFFSRGVATKREYANVSERTRYVEELNIPIGDKRTITASSLTKLSAISTPFTREADIKEILDNFDNKVSTTNLNWSQDEYYVWIRNCFRELGLEALYTGSGGKLKRADVTLRKPFFAGIEVKSPAEGDISVGAIRQALDAGREVADTYQSKVTYSAVVGKEIGTRVHARAVSWYNYNKSKVPLVRGRYLLYLVMKHKTGLLQDPLDDVQRLFSDFYGWFGKEELREYFRAYFQRRTQQLAKGQVQLPLPPEIDRIWRTRDIAKALDVSRQTEEEIYKEIERCFPDPERRARGGYVVK